MANIITAGNSTNGGTAITTDTSGTLNIVTGSGSGATAIAVDTSQNVGIGTTAPNYKVTVNSSSTNSYQQLTNSVTGSASGDGFLVGIDSLEAIVWNLENSNIKFATNNTERMRIDSSGGLILVGSTAQKATGTTWSNPSDQRLKNNIRDYTKGTAELMQVRVKEWEYNGKGGTIDGTKGIGVIADEIMTVLPNTVENYNAKLNSNDEETTEIKKFDATEITWLLVKTVQELKAELDAVKAKVGA